MMSLPGGRGTKQLDAAKSIQFQSCVLLVRATWLNAWPRLNSDQHVSLRSRTIVISATRTAKPEHPRECIVHGRNVRPPVLYCRELSAAGAANSNLEARRHLRRLRSSRRHGRRDRQFRGAVSPRHPYLVAVQAVARRRAAVVAEFDDAG